MTYILYNPIANGGHGYNGVKTVQKAFRAETPEVLDVTAMDAGAFLRELTAVDKVILCGGDGTVHHLVNDLDGVPPAVPIYVWRFGTGNDFIRDVAGGTGGEAQMVLLNDHMGNLPTADVDGQRCRFLNGCSAGVDALVCQMLEESRHKPGKASYVALAIQAIFRKYRPMSGRVTVDGETREYKKLWMCVAMNGRLQGGGMWFAPDQDRNSGVLCCMAWHDTTPLGTLLRFPSVIRGTHAKFTNVCDIRFGREITVELDEPAPVQTDGEVIGGVTRFTARK